MQPFTLEEFSSHLTRSLSRHRPRTVTDVTPKGRRVLEFILPHPTEPRFSVSLQAEEIQGYVEKCTLWFGQAEITGALPPEDAVSAIEEIAADRVVAIVRYKNRSAYDDHRKVTSAPCQWIYQFTGDGDDDTAAFERMVERLRSPASAWERFRGQYVGVFEIIRWSGSEVLER